MLAFITTLRHPDNATDYDAVERQLRGTLASVAAQRRGEFVVVVVGNRRPGFEMPAGVEFVQVDFPAPAPANGPHAARDDFVRDKGTKVGMGLLAVRERRPDHVMIFDADDFVHRDLAAWENARHKDAGWVVSDGWMFSGSTGSAVPIDRFNRTCGTSMIAPYAAFRVPDDMTTSATQQEILAAFGDVLPAIMGAHRNALPWLAERGYVLHTLPFRAAIYHVDTGENHSGKTLTDHLEKIGAAVPGYVPRPLGLRVAREFGVSFPLRRRVAWWVRNGIGYLRGRARAARAD